jgi:maltooligosyltrehalose trehalohydrolase
MPVAQFPGARNWGYDGVYPFAVQTSYGGAAGFKRLIDAAHQREMSVILDVVYNHLGPEGNYLREFGPYFTDQYRTPWGEPLNFDGPHSDAVRDYFLNNARMWQEEFRLDGLRLDAVPWVKDFSASHVLADLADQARGLSARLGRRFHLIGESDLNDPRVIRPRDRGGLGLDAQWSDDFHHALHAYLTGERGGYYADHGSLAGVAKAYRDAYVLTGQYSHFRRRRYGAPADDRPGEQFVIFAQNHDQVGNRPRGDRLSALVDFDTLKLVAGLLLTSPYVPMLFMGEEYGETAPFPFFVHHSDGGLIDRIRRGRRGEFHAFGMHADPLDPAAEDTFRRAKLNVGQADHGRGRELAEWHRELLRLRRERPALASLDRRRMRVMHHDAEQLLVVLRWSSADRVLVVMNFGRSPVTTNLPIPEGAWAKLLDSSAAGDARSDLRGPGETWLTLEARSFALWASGA